MDKFEQLESKAAAGQTLTRAEVEAIAASSDLVRIGVLGETARRALCADRVTFGRVALAPREGQTIVGHAGELRIVATPESIDEARARTRAAVAEAGVVPVTGYSLSSLLGLVRGDLRALAALAGELRADGLQAVAEVPIDKFPAPEALIAAVRAVGGAGLGAWRVTVDRASLDERLDLIDRVLALQQATSAVRAFAPLPRLDAVETPSTGYDDVRTIAIARVRLTSIPFIQVDWPLYGPKLAQVAIAFGANDVDGIDVVDDPALGRRRAAREDIERQIRAAAAVPAERNGRYELRS